MAGMRVAGAVRLCQKKWQVNYTGGFSQSSSSGWGHTYYWWGEVITVPIGGLYLVTTETWAGDNDSAWHHYRAKSDGMFIPGGYHVAIYGGVKQACSNAEGTFWVSGTLYLLRPNGGALLSSPRTYVSGGPSGCGLECCCCSSASEDIDRAMSRISIRNLAESDAAAHGMLWTEAQVRAVM
ncbi:MAG: hypothetical protein LBT45_00490 [Rickettsiales bacterium]|nr:hypothetical protein [Rickettsiales bacterium]